MEPKQTLLQDTDSDIRGDILEALSDAILKLDEASGIAKTEYGENSRIVSEIESAWDAAYTLRENFKNGHISFAA